MKGSQIIEGMRSDVLRCLTYQGNGMMYLAIGASFRPSVKKLSDGYNINYYTYNYYATKNTIHNAQIYRQSPIFSLVTRNTF